MAVTSGWNRRPSETTMNETSRPRRNSSMTILRPAAPNFFWTSISPAVSSAFFGVGQTTTPLPAARPSALTTTG
jgi:hypothetical protein